MITAETKEEMWKNKTRRGQHILVQLLTTKCQDGNSWSIYHQTK